jgi:hypothetical protein
MVRIPVDEIRISQDCWELPRLIDRPSFQQRDATMRVLSESCSQHRPGGAATNNDYIRLHRSAPLVKLLYGVSPQGLGPLTRQLYHLSERPLRGGGLLRVRGKELPHQGREGHIQRGVQVVGQRAGVVLQDLNHRGGIIRDDDASLR